MSGALTDKLLFQAVQEGDENAFEMLFRSYYPSLCQVAFELVRDKEIAEELVSDMFLKIWNKRTTLQIHSSVGGYLHFAVRNHALNYLKSKKMRFVDLEEIESSLPSTDQDPAQVMITDEVLKAWEKKIRQLPPQRQKVFRMNKLEGLSYAEIAAKLALSEKTVRNQVQTAVRSLEVLALLLLFSFFI